MPYATLVKDRVKIQAAGVLLRPQYDPSQTYKIKEDSKFDKDGDPIFPPLNDITFTVLTGPQDDFRYQTAALSCGLHNNPECILVTITTGNGSKQIFCLDEKHIEKVIS